MQQSHKTLFRPLAGPACGLTTPQDTCLAAFCKDMCTQFYPHGHWSLQEAQDEVVGFPKADPAHPPPAPSWRHCPRQVHREPFSATLNPCLDRPGRLCPQAQDLGFAGPSHLCPPSGLAFSGATGAGEKGLTLSLSPLPVQGWLGRAGLKSLQPG